MNADEELRSALEYADAMDAAARRLWAPGPIKSPA